MKKTLIALCLLAWSGLAQAQSPSVVLSASATSSSSNSSPVACLLDPACNGAWSPASLDSGVDEGIYIQFQKPLAAGSVEICFGAGADASNTRITAYLNGKTTGKKGAYVAFDPGSAANCVVLRYRDASGLDESIKSLFLKLEKSYSEAKVPQITKIRFYRSAEPTASQLIALAVPQPIPSSVSATSILEPASAYHPAMLFDSKYDMAWSSDGKKNNGVNESFSIAFAKPLDLKGMIVWNGYQRSDTHFKANGRVAELELRAGSQAPQLLKLKDAMGPQEVAFSPTLKQASQLAFILKNIYPGAQYKDVLISEIRFVDAQGNLVAPAVALPKVAAPAAFGGLLDRSYSSFLHQPRKEPEDSGMKCDNERIRLRSNGTFVIYKDFEFNRKDRPERPQNMEANVLEGNWEPKGDKLRLFGRQYQTSLLDSDYLQERAVSKRPVTIFQSELSAKPYQQLSAEEKNKLFTYLWNKKKGPATQTQKLYWSFSASSYASAEGASQAELFKSLDALLQKLNPYYLSSSVLTDLVLPTDQVDACPLIP